MKWPKSGSYILLHYTSASSQSEISASAERAESEITTAAVFLLLSGMLVENRRVDRSSVDLSCAHRLDVLVVYCSLIVNKVALVC